jgi:hypothetical protein
MYDLGPHDLDVRIDRRLAGEMAEIERAAFDRAVESDDRLGEAWRMSHAIDESIRRSFAASIPPDALERVRATAAGASAPDLNHERTVVATLWRRPWAAAAALAVLLGGAWMILNTLTGSNQGYVAGPWRTLQQAYDDAVTRGFQPLWRCENDAEFQAAFFEQFGQPLSLGDASGPFAAVGLNYSHTLTPRTSCVLFQINDSPVLVFVDRLERDRAVGNEVRDPLFLHRREIGTLVLYEVSPFQEAAALPMFRLPPEG